MSDWRETVSCIIYISSYPFISSPNRERKSNQFESFFPFIFLGGVADSKKRRTSLYQDRRPTAGDDKIESNNVFSRPFQSGRIRCRRPAAALSPRWVAGTPSGAEAVLAGGRDGTENRGIRRPGRVEMETLSGRRRTGRYPVLFCFNLMKLIFLTTERGTIFSYTGVGVLTLLPPSCDHSWGRRGGRGGRGRDLRNDDDKEIFLRYDSL